MPDLVGVLVTVLGGEVTVTGGWVTVAGGAVTVAGAGASVVAVESVSGTAEVEASGETDSDGEESVEVPVLHAVRNMTSPALMTRALFRSFTSCSTDLLPSRTLRLPRISENVLMHSSAICQERDQCFVS